MIIIIIIMMVMMMTSGSSRSNENNSSSGMSQVDAFQSLLTQCLRLQSPKRDDCT